MAFALAVVLIAAGAGAYYLFFNHNSSMNEQKDDLNLDLDSGSLSTSPATDSSSPDTASPEQQKTYAIMKTNFGEISLELFTEDAPQTVANFIKLANEGFYDGTKFHRVIKDFMIQGGDPLSKDDDWSNDGMGGPGYTFKDEINSHKLVKGTLAMANSGPDTNGSQFFIVTADATPWLDGHHTVFGRVTGGMDTVTKIENVATNANDHPTEDVVVESIKIVKM